MSTQLGLFDNKEKFVRRVRRNECTNFILNIHYARRWCPISYSFGLFVEKELVGVATYGYPPSRQLKEGIAGKKNASKVLELNRLCLLYNKKNQASFLVGNSIKLLPKETIIVSFADTEQDHLGIVYQASNFVYTGLSAKRKNWRIKGKEHLHSYTIADEFSGNGRIDAIKEKYGDRFYYEERPRKHRYLFFHGSKTFKKQMRKDLIYQIHPYPKKSIRDGLHPTKSRV